MHKLQFCVKQDVRGCQDAIVAALFLSLSNFALRVLTNA